MPKVVLASTLARWVPAAGDRETALEVAAATVGEALEGVFALHPSLRGYVLDDQGAVRHHVAIFVDGIALHDKRDLQVPLAERAEVYVMQALSGG